MLLRKLLGLGIVKRLYCGNCCKKTRHAIFRDVYDNEIKTCLVCKDDN